jgi:hypothetical protein
VNHCKNAIEGNRIALEHIVATFTSVHIVTTICFKVIVLIV